MPTSGSTHLGVNIEAITDYARLVPFVDLMKVSRPWGTVAAPYDEKAPVDALGWPTSDAGVVVFMVTSDPEDNGSTYRNIPPGTYKLGFTGRATVRPSSSANVSVTSMTYDSATDTSTADVVVAPGAYQMFLTFTGTSGGVRNVSLRRPGYAADETFTNEFKQALAPFGVIRFMDYLRTNNNETRTWAERTTPAHASQANRRYGASWEYVIRMANELHKDIWINIPANADDDYVRQLATMLHRQLEPGRVVYIEYSNEVWNFMFKQATENMNAAVAEAIAGDLSLTKGVTCTQALFDQGGTCNKYWSGFYRVGKKITRIGQIFGEVMGASAFGTRFRPVYATQWANRGMGEQVLKNMAKYRGAPKSLIYGIAGAPYFGVKADVYNSTTLTSAQILDALQQSVDVAYAPYFKVGMTLAGVYSPGTPYNGADYVQPTMKALADYYGIQSLAYEGGLELGQSEVNALAKMQANKDPRMGAINEDYLEQWFGCGNGLFLQYTLTSAWNRWGYWGLTNNPYNLDTPRYVVHKRVAETPRASFTVCK